MNSVDQPVQINTTEVGTEVAKDIPMASTSHTIIKLKPTAEIPDEIPISLSHTLIRLKKPEVSIIPTEGHQIQMAPSPEDPTGKKPFPCPMCEESFLKRKALSLHELTHAGGEPFGCDDCDKKFPNASELRRHQVTHTGGKAHTCPHCDKRFALKHGLKQHLRRCIFLRYADLTSHRLSLTSHRLSQHEADEVPKSNSIQERNAPLMQTVNVGSPECQGEIVIEQQIIVPEIKLEQQEDLTCLIKSELAEDIPEDPLLGI